MTDQPLPEHRRPDGVNDATVEAVGKLSEAFEAVETARGALYAFHRLTGNADLLLGDAVSMLREAGHTEIADGLERDIVGRNVIQGRWTFQVVEEYDDSYFEPFRAAERRVVADLMVGHRHVFESEMKERERTHGAPHHDAVPHDGGTQSYPPS